MELDSQALDLRGEHFFDAFPFHFAVDSSLEIVQFGRSLPKLIPQFGVGTSLAKLLELERPSIPLNFQELSNRCHSLLLFKAIDSGVKLKGEMRLVSGCLLFLGSPWFTRPEDLREHALTFSDFANHDSVVDMLQLVQSHRMALSSATGAADKLAQKSRELERAKQEAEKANHAKTEFVAMMSHEVRTPLHGIIGSAQMCSLTELTEQQTGFLKNITLSAEALLHTLNEVLDYAKMESGKLQIENVGFDLHTTVEEAVATFAHIAHTKEVDLALKIDPQVPRKVKGDPTRVRQILVNLIDNALKFTKQGTVSVSVSAAEENPDKKDCVLIFRVRDTGIGIPSQQLEHIFESFVQADSSTTRNFGGSGLGLTICSTLVACMKGEIRVHSSPGSGSEFTVLLHLGLDGAHPIATPETTTQTSGVIEADKLRVLVVDDCPLNRALACEFLKADGHSTVVAEDGRTALDQVAREEFDLVLMDLAMPCMDGLAATRAIREWEEETRTSKRTPIIAVTANVADGIREQCLEAGMDEYLAKPIHFEQLRLMIGKVLEFDPTYVAGQNQSEPEAPAVSDLQILDCDTALSNFDGRIDIYDSLIPTFFEERDELLPQLTEAINAGDAAKLQRLAHTLKSSVATFGGMRATEAALRLENVGRDGNLAIAEEAHLALLEELKHFESALRDRQNNKR